MNAIVYSWTRSLKNRFLQVLKKPFLIILYLLMVGALGFVLFGMPSLQDAAGEKHVTGYAAILIGVFLFILGLSVVTGLKQGTALFSMADVNLLFVSPVSPRKVLMAGILRQAGVLLAASIFMVFQYPNMRNAGLDGYALLGLMAAYALLGFSSQVISALLYAFCAGSAQRRKAVNNGITVLCAAIALGFFLSMRTGTVDIKTALVAFFGADWWNYVPFLGWARGLAVALATYQWGGAVVYMLIFLIGIFLCVLLLQKTQMDYFEDVLLAAERANQKQQDAKEGRISVQGDVSAKIKREKGPLYGHGALAFTGRILREQSRSGVWLLDMYSLGALAGPVMALIFMPQAAMEGGWLWGVLNMSVWVMIFFNLTGGIARELNYPVLYLAPAGAFQKLAASMLPQLMKAAVDGLFFAVFSTLVFHGTILEGIFGWASYFGVSTLYAAGVLIVERVLGANKNKALIMVVYIFLLMLLVMPGLIGAMILSESAPAVVAYLVFLLWCFVISALSVFFCRGVLHNIDLI